MMMIAALILSQSWVFVGGRELENLCRREVPRCHAYLEGVSDTFEDSQGSAAPVTGICKPQGVTIGQFREVVLRYIRANPEARSEGGPRIVLAALRGAYPCPEGG